LSSYAPYINGITVWRVQVGNLYYLQSLLRKFTDEGRNREYIDYEFTAFIEAAWLFPFEHTAKEVAEISGGKVEKLVISNEEYLRLTDIRNLILHKYYEKN